jgi:hypothetical protein
VAVLVVEEIDFRGLVILELEILDGRGVVG